MLLHVIINTDSTGSPHPMMKWSYAVPDHLLLDCLNMIITVHTCFGKEKKHQPFNLGKTYLVHKIIQ